MKLLSIISIAIGLLFGQIALAQNVCEDQIFEYLEEGLDLTVEKIQFVQHAGVTTRGEAWVNVSECAGQIVFNLNSKTSACKTTHYGTVPNYIHHVFATGNCKALLK